MEKYFGLILRSVFDPFLTPLFPDLHAIMVA